MNVKRFIPMLVLLILVLACNEGDYENVSFKVCFKSKETKAVVVNHVFLIENWYYNSSPDASYGGHEKYNSLSDSNGCVEHQFEKSALIQFWHKADTGNVFLENIYAGKCISKTIWLN